MRCRNLGFVLSFSFLIVGVVVSICLVEVAVRNYRRALDNVSTPNISALVSHFQQSLVNAFIPTVIGALLTILALSLYTLSVRKGKKPTEGGR